MERLPKTPEMRIVGRNDCGDGRRIGRGHVLSRRANGPEPRSDLQAISMRLRQPRGMAPPSRRRLRSGCSDARVRKRVDVDLVLASSFALSKAQDDLRTAPCRDAHEDRRRRSLAPARPPQSLFPAGSTPLSARFESAMAEALRLHSAQVIRAPPAPLPAGLRRSLCDADEPENDAQHKMANTLTHRYAAFGQAVFENCLSQATFSSRLRSRGLP